MPPIGTVRCSLAISILARQNRVFGASSFAGGRLGFERGFWCGDGAGLPEVPPGPASDSCIEGAPRVLAARQATLLSLVIPQAPQAQGPYGGKPGWLSASRGMPCQTAMPKRLRRHASSGPGSPGGASCSIPWKACGSPFTARERSWRPAARRRWASGWKQQRGARPGQMRASRPRPGAPSGDIAKANRLRQLSLWGGPGLRLTAVLLRASHAIGTEHHST